MGVGADDEAGAAVEEKAHGLDFRGRLGVEIDEDRIGLFAERAGGDRRFDGAERIVDRVHEHAAQRVDHQHAVAIAALDQIGAASGRARRHVDRPHQRRFALDIALRVALVPGVIAERHRIGTGGAQIAIVPLGQALAVAGVLAVDDDEIETVGRNDAGQALCYRVTPRASDHIAKKQQLHAAAFSKVRAPFSVMIASSGISCGSRGTVSSSCAAKARPMRRGFLLSLASVRS